jgi:hypothetical protein
MNNSTYDYKCVKSYRELGRSQKRQLDVCWPAQDSTCHHGPDSYVKIDALRIDGFFEDLILRSMAF